MTEDWDKQNDIFYDALDLSVDERRSFLDRVCAGVATPKRDIEELLSYHAEGQAFFLRLTQDLGVSEEDGTLLANGEIVAERFEIRRFLARGGFAEVYEAFDRELDELVALKVLRGEWIDP